MGETSYVLVDPSEYEAAKEKALKLAVFGITLLVFHCPQTLARWLAVHQGSPVKPLCTPWPDQSCLPLVSDQTAMQVPVPAVNAPNGLVLTVEQHKAFHHLQ